MENLIKFLFGEGLTPQEEEERRRKERKEEERRRRREERRRRRREERRRRREEEGEGEEEEEEESSSQETYEEDLEEAKKSFAPLVKRMAKAGPSAYYWDPVPEGVPSEDGQTWTDRAMFGYFWQGQKIVLGDLEAGYCMPFAVKEVIKKKLNWRQCLDIGSHGLVDASRTVLPFLKKEGKVFKKFLNNF